MVMSSPTAESFLLRACHRLLVALTLAGAQAAAATFALPIDGEDLVGETATVTAKHEDTLLDIARRNGLGYREIVAANPGVDPWLPGAGTQVLLPTQFILPERPRRGIVVSLAQMRLFYYPQPAGGEATEVVTFPIGIGREYLLPPVGDTHVTRKVENPTWHPPDWIREAHAKDGEVLPRSVPPGPDNPLGAFALYLGMPGYLIHGTNRPWGIGMRVSGGCIRLYPEDVQRLFAQVPVGAQVRIENEPFVLGRHEGRLYVKVFPALGDDAEPADRDLTPLVKAILARLNPGERADFDAAMRAAQERRGVPSPVSLPAR
jgi:L,D-transpeptidase ErfK/SrfK